MTEEMLRRIDDDRMQDLRKRMEMQDRLLLEIRDSGVANATMLKQHTETLNLLTSSLDEHKETLTTHIAEENQIKPALDELIGLWRGSKIIIPIVASLGAGVAWLITWLKDHHFLR